MSKFIELTNGGLKRLVNVDNISYIKDEEEPSGCLIYFIGGESLYVDEPFNRVQSLIHGDI